jgi:hypothetical protein
MMSKWGYLLVVAIAFYIVWSVLAGFFGYFYRFFRFWAKLAPLVGLIGWVMAQSGHGSLPEVMDLVKQWVGIGNTGLGAQGQAAGISQLASMFGLGGNSNANAKANKRSKRTTRSSTRSKKPAAGAGVGVGMEDLADILKSATGAQAGEDLQGSVQGFLKNAALKAAGLDWLFGQETKEEPKKRTR